MKIRFLLALVGLAISFTLPLFAQQKDTVDPRIVQQRDLLGDAKALGEFGALGMKADEAFNNNDAVAVAALFTENAVLVASDGMFCGRQAIEKRYATHSSSGLINTFSSQMCHQLNAIDNAVWSAGEWWSTLQSQTGMKFERGRWSAIYVREGDAWKIRLFTVSERSKPAQLLRRSSSIKSACAAGVENAQRIEQFSDAELLEELKRRNVPHTVFCGINHKEELDQLCVERLIAFQIGDAAIEV